LYFFGGVASFPVRKHLAESFVSYQINYQDDAMMCFHTGFTLNGQTEVTLAAHRWRKNHLSQMLQAKMQKNY
jgi:hypothetical protein